jgi:hypothetical protein
LRAWAVFAIASILKRWWAPSVDARTDGPVLACAQNEPQAAAKDRA